MGWEQEPLWLLMGIKEGLEPITRGVHSLPYFGAKAFSQVG